MDYPSLEEERRIVVETTGEAAPKLETVLGAAEVLRASGLGPPRAGSGSDRGFRGQARARATRPKDELSPENVRTWISWGAGPRASQAHRSARRRALCWKAVSRWRARTSCASPSRSAPLRLVLNYQAEAEGVSADDLVGRILDRAMA